MFIIIYLAVRVNGVVDVVVVTQSARIYPIQAHTHCIQSTLSHIVIEMADDDNSNLSLSHSGLSQALILLTYTRSSIVLSQAIYLKLWLARLKRFCAC